MLKYFKAATKLLVKLTLPKRHILAKIKGIYFTAGLLKLKT